MKTIEQLETMGHKLYALIRGEFGGTMKIGLFGDLEVLAFDYQSLRRSVDAQKKAIEEALPKDVPIVTGDGDPASADNIQRQYEEFVQTMLTYGMMHGYGQGVVDEQAAQRVKAAKK